MPTANITTLSIVMDPTQGVSVLCSLAVTYNTQETFVVGRYNGTAVPVNLNLAGNTTMMGKQVVRYSFNIGAGDFVNKTIITYGFVMEKNATVINAINFTTMSGAIYAIGQADPQLAQTGFAGILKGFKGYGIDAIAALGIYAITKY